MQNTSTDGRAPHGAFGGLARATPLIATVLLTAWKTATGAEPLGLLLESGGFLILSLCLLLWPAPSDAEPTPRAAVLLRRCVVAACLLLHYSVLTTKWPLKVSFALARPALETLAASVRRGDPFHGPQRAGLFVIRGVDRSRYADAVCLWTNLNPHGHTGFVAGSPNFPAYPHSETRLNERWRLLAED